MVTDDDSNTKTESNKQPAKTPQQPASISSTPSAAALPTTFAQAAGIQIDNGEFTDYLNKVFTERNFPGPDYYEFVEGLKKLATAPLDEKTKFISLFAGLNAAGLSKEKLIQTAQQYIAIVNEQQVAFKAEVQNTINTDVAAKEQKMQQHVDENAQIEQQMIALSERKNSNIAAINKYSQEIAEDRQTLAIKETSFDSAVKIFVNTISENIRKINEYL